MDETQLYEEVAAELDAAQTKPGLWAKAFAEADGEPNKTRALYIRLRVAQLIRERRGAADVGNQQAVAIETSEVAPSGLSLPLSYKNPKELVDLLLISKPDEANKDENQHVIHTLAGKMGIGLEKIPELAKIIGQVLELRTNKLYKARLSFKWALGLFAIAMVLIGGHFFLSYTPHRPSEFLLLGRFVSLCAWGPLLYALWCRLTAPGRRQVLGIIRRAKGSDA